MILRSSREAGAAAADFALVSGLVVLLFVGMLQVGYALHVRNTAVAHAIEGARIGARADATPEQGAARTRELLGTSLVSRYGTAVSAGRTSAGGAELVLVSVTLPVPILGPLGPPGAMTVEGYAYAEGQG